MKETQFFIKRVLSFIFLCINISISSAKSISLCLNESEQIICGSDQRIVITYAEYVYIPFIENINVNLSRWCSKRETYIHSIDDCVKSDIRKISTQCTGYKSCYVTALSNNSSHCKYHKNSSYEQLLNIKFDCVYKELFFSPDQMENVHFVGGYMTSVGYSLQKSADRDGLKVLAKSFRQSGHLPIKKVFKARLFHGGGIRHEFVFQFRIMENSISSINQSVISRTCQMGELYSQDFYAFTSTNETQRLSVCSSNPGMIGRTFGPILTNDITIDVNVNFTSMTESVLLIKFTMILCPFIVVENADVTYDHVAHVDEVLSVSGVAIITCYVGFFLLSESSRVSNVSTKTLRCDHSTGLWKGLQRSEACVNKLATQSPTSTSEIASSIDTGIKHPLISTSYFQSSSTTNASVIVFISSEATLLSSNNFLRYVTVLFVVLLVCAISLFLIWKCRKKSIYLTQLFDLFSKNETLSNTNHQLNPKVFVRQSFGHNFIFDDTTPMTESWNLFTSNLSPTGSCRQSTRTLTTRVDSRPTIFSTDTMQTSNYMFDSNLNIVPHEEELPTKLPRISTITKLKRSASNLRKSSLAMLRPNSMSRQSFIDMNSDMCDVKFAGSAIPLLMSRRTSIPAEFVDSNSVMCTSDISPAKGVSLRKKHMNRPYSHSDLSCKSKANERIMSPTTDTYLEPTESTLQLNSLANERQRNIDYVTYDLSRISSNNPDTTLQSSVIASLVDENANDEDEKKRFSMISNNYYGIQDGNPRHSHHQMVNSVNCCQENVSLNSNESIYESIDDYQMYQSTIDRRHIALPLLPNED